MFPSDDQETREGFETYLRSCAYTTKSIATILRYMETYRKWVEEEGMKIEEVGYTDLLGYMQDRQKRGLTPRTLRHYLGVLRRYYDYLLKERRVATNPASGMVVQGVKKRSLYSILESHELHQLYHQYPGSGPKDKRHKVMLGLMVYQGVRTGELDKLEVQDVGLKEGKVHVPGTFNSNSRVLPLESVQVLDLYDYILQAREALIRAKAVRMTKAKVHPEKLFIGEEGRSYSISGFVTQLMRMVREQNPKVENAHQLRASVITRWLKQYNLREVQYLAGHRYVSSTEQYLQNEIEGLKEEIERFHPLR